MYFNKITKKMTEYPYRFKTDEEFVEEFGEEYDNVEDGSFIGWFPNMGDFFGEDFDLDYDRDFDQHSGCYLLHGDNGDSWYIDNTMLVKNEKGINYNKSPKLVYERKILSFKKFNNK